MTATETIDPQQAWDVLEQRDASFDRAFYYGVTTTGIYCRPSCPSRRPRRENVRYFDSTEEAEAAGFRACLRCHPKQPAKTDVLVARVRQLLDARPGEAVSLASLGRVLQVSPTHLQRTFKRLMGVSPQEYVQASRRGAIRRQLRQGDAVASATYDAGFGSSSRVYEDADTLFGMAPGRYRRGGLGVDVVYGARPCGAGHLLIATTERGICFLAMGNSEAELEQELRDELPRATFSHDESLLSDFLDAAAAYFEGVSEAQPPLDLRGSEFQLLVWKFLKTIAVGQTLTYGEVAQSIGRPTAARAVARACASNPVALFVPCHRVVRSDGAARGYRWGMERKLLLLANEKEASRSRIVKE